MYEILRKAMFDILIDYKTQDMHVLLWRCLLIEHETKAKSYYNYYRRWGVPGIPGNLILDPGTQCTCINAYIASFVEGD